MSSRLRDLVNKQPDVLSGIYPEVIDKTEGVEEPNKTSSVFIAGPSKFGTEALIDFDTKETMEAKIGKENSYKYGIAQYCAKKFMSNGAKIIWSRIVHPNATFANAVIYNDGGLKEVSVSGITNQNQLGVLDPDSTNTQLENIKENRIYSILGKGRGSGYNDLFSIFNKTSYEKFEAENDGEIKYQFNFLETRVYEAVKPIVAKTDNMLISLMEVDPNELTPIVNINTGDNIFVNEIGKKNDFVTMKINKSFRQELLKYPNIQSLCNDKGTPRIIIEDESTLTLPVESKIFYELIIDDENGSPTIKLVKTGLPRVKEAIFALGADYYRFTAKVVNGIAQLHREQVTLETGAPFFADSTKVYVRGENAFYEMTLKAENDEPTLDIQVFSFLRWELWNYLKNINHKLQGGEDYTSISGGTSIGPFTNIDGSINIRNVSLVMDDKLNNNEEIIERFYPKYKFNYFFEWTQDLNVIDTSFYLADALRRTMNFVAIPSIRKVDLNDDRSELNDITARDQIMSLSTYNSVISSSQMNSDVEDGKIYKLPSNFYNLLNNIIIDDTVSPTEPAANIEKGKLRANVTNLSNEFYSSGIENLKKKQINGIITDGQSTYFLEQVTAFKKNGKLGLVNVVKALQRLQIAIPDELKPYIQRKETDSIISSVLNKVNSILKPYKQGEDEIFKSVDVTVSYNNNKLTVSILLTPIGTIEQILVPIAVEG